METTNEATYNFGKEEYTKKNLTPTDILDLAFAYTQTPITRIVGKKLDDRIKTANDVSRLTGMMQLEPTKKSGKPALILHLLKNSLVTKDEYIKLFKELVEVHKSIVKYLKNASPERRSAGAARAAAKDMKGEFDESVNEENKSPEEILQGLNEMAMGNLERIEDYAEMISDRMEQGQQLESWMFSEITQALNGLNSVHDAMDGKDGIKEAELPKAMIPSSIKAKLDMAIGKIKDTNLSYTQKLQVIGKIIDSLGIDKKELTKISSRIKGTLESVNEASMSDIDIIAQEARDFKDFVKEFFNNYKDFPKTKDSLKWLEDIYKGRTKMEGLDKDGMERVASGLPQTQEEN